MKSSANSIQIRMLVLCIIIFTTSQISFAQLFTLNQTLSDGAQRNTIAFNGLAFTTGDFCSCSFIPPGKVADFFGFQYMRDNDITHMGHNTDFLTVIANNLLFCLDTSQKALLINAAQDQVEQINRYAYERFPLINAFIRLRDNDIPASSTGLDKETIKCYSGNLYKLDGRLSLKRAQLYANIINSLSQQKKNYLDSIYNLGMQNMPVLPEQFDKTLYTHDESVAIMSFAGDIFSWYVGNLDADVYFCPERQGNYFGSFYVKDAPAMGNPGYSIDTNLTQNGGINFLAALNSTQSQLITSLVDTQSLALNSIVTYRTNISNHLRNYLLNTNVDTNIVLALCEIYGELDGEISYYYATNFSAVYSSLTMVQKAFFDSLVNLDDFPCSGAYVYSTPIASPSIINTDFLFTNTANNPLAVSVNISSNPAILQCQGTAVTFTAVAINGGYTPVFQWKVNGITVGTNSSTFTYTPLNGDQVSCILTSGLYCATLSGNPAISNILTMNVPNVVAPTVPVFSIYPKVVCRNQGGFVFSVYNVPSAISYNWTISPGGIITSGQGTTSVTISFSANANSGTVRVNAVNNCGSSALVGKNYLIVTTPPAIPAQITGPTTVLPNSIHTFSIANVQNAVSYTWTVPQFSTIMSGQGSNTISLYFGPGWNGGNLMVYSENCAGISQPRSLKIKRISKGTDSNNKDCITPSVKKVEDEILNQENTIQLYPNPNSGELTINYKTVNNSILNIEMRDLSGKIVLKKEFNVSQGNNTFISTLENIENGLYILSFIENNKLIRQQKLILSH